MEKITFKENGLSFELNKTDNTASIISSPKAKGEVFIPRVISYNNQDYIITKIKEGAFKGNRKLKLIKFSEDSEISTIEKEAFAASSLLTVTLPQKVVEVSKSVFNSCKSLKKLTIEDKSHTKSIGPYSISFTPIESITFSDSIEKVEEGWCSNTSKLNNVIISPNNKNFAYIDEDHKLIAGKSDLTQPDFDVLVFACRDIKKAVIPSNIKYIDSFAFHECKELEEVKINEDSKLVSIDKKAFFQSSLQKIFIPQFVDEIKECCFAETGIKNIFVSPKNQRFALIEEKILISKSDIKSEEYDTVVFAFDKFTNVVIPSFIKTISPYSFYKNKKLSIVKFSDDSQLTSFGESSFSETSLLLLLVPKHVKKIGVGSFSSCRSLKNVEFSPLSELEEIEEGAFYETSIESISIPVNVKKIGEFSFGQCHSLNEVLFQVNSKLELIDKNAFAASGIKTFYLPDKVKKIEEGAFGGCNELTSFHFPRKGSVDSIGERAFSDSAINSIIIPSYVKRIEERAFFNCYLLREVEIPPNSELNFIGENAFNNCPLINIFIPTNVPNIKKNCFVDCTNFCGVAFGRNSQITSIEKNAFSNTLMEDISFPPQLQDLSGKSFANVPLNVITISKKNHYLSKHHDNIIMKKTDIKSTRADTIVLGYNQIDEVKVPSNVKHIAPYAFYLCYDLSQISFSKNSELQTIGRNAFISTTIQSITIPKHVKKIEKKTFSECRDLKTVDFEKDSELQTIEKEAFCKSGIEKLTIPSQLNDLQYCWCSYTSCLNQIVLSPQNKCLKYLDGNNKIIIGKSNPNIDVFDSIVIACRDIVTAHIPSYIKFIKTFAFDNCKKLKSVEFDNDSNLFSIERNAFSKTAIEKFVLPKSVKEINKKAFLDCQNLSVFELFEDSELAFIGNYAFAYTSIKEIVIPTQVTKVGEHLFANCAELESATFLSDLFYIDNNCFESCKKLAEVSFPNARLVFKEDDPFKNAASNFKLNIKDGAELM